MDDGSSSAVSDSLMETARFVVSNQPGGSRVLFRDALNKCILEGTGV
jgi:hypothetical protein